GQVLVGTSSTSPRCMFGRASRPSAICSVRPRIRLRLRSHAEIFSQLDSYLRFLTRRHFLDCREYIEHHLFAGVRGRMGLVFHRFPSGASSGDYHRCFRTVGEAVELKPRLNALSVYQTREIWSFHLFLFINPGSSPRSFRAWAMALAALLRRHAGRMVSRIAW